MAKALTAGKRLLALVRRLLALLIITSTGFWSLVALFSDAYAGYSIAALATIIVITHFVLGLLLGLLLVRKWYWSLLGAWGGGLVDLTPLVHLARTGELGAGAYPGSPVLGLLVIPITLCLGGYVGSLPLRVFNRTK